MSEQAPVTDVADGGAGLVEVEQIIAGLEVQGRVCPVDALRAAQRQRELVTPRLIDVLRKAVEQVRSEGKVPGNAHWFGVMLLTEFKAREAFPLILEAISLPGDQPYELLGDLITEKLPSILAQFVDSPDELDRLIDNQIDKYVRWSAAGTYLLLVRDGRLSREEAVERLRRLLRNVIDNRERMGEADATALVVALSYFASPAALPEIEEAFQLHLVDEFAIGLDEVRADAADDEEAFEESLRICRRTGVVDTVAELSLWFEEDPFDFESENEQVEPPSWPARGFDRAADTLYEEDAYEPVAAIRRTEERVGRNEPCPCGSGKKFKKCCGAS